MEDKKNIKQWVVAGIILVVAVLLLVLVFSERKTDKPVMPTIPAAVEKAPVAEKAATEVKKQIETTASAFDAEAEKEIIEVEPQNVVLSFMATAEKDFIYQVFYTVEREVWFDESHVVDYQGKSGTHKYSIVIPSAKVFRVRLDFASNPGTVTLKDIKVAGSQQADLNDFSGYELHQIDMSSVNEDGSLTIISRQEDPYIAYRSPLLPE